MNDEQTTPIHRRSAAHPPTLSLQSPTHRSEPELRTAVAATLRAHGIVVTEKVPCAAGEADIVTACCDAIFEIKHRLTRRALYQATGQVLLYRLCINPHARAIVVGYATDETAGLLPVIQTLGIEVICWKDEGGRMKAEGEPEQNRTADSPGSAVIPHPSSFPASSLILPPSSFLRWNVAALALERGFTNVSRLASRMHAPRQSVYRIWRDEAAQVSLEMLGRLVRVLDADPGDWFSWIETVEDRALIWNVQGRMQALGLTPTRLGFRAELYSGSIVPIVDGIAQAVSLDALGKLARALDAPDHPFAIGDLFIWDEP